MGRLYLINLEGRIYSCKHCKTHLGLCDDIVSKSFHCRHGKAYLFSKVVNISTGEKEERMMMTGLHTVADIFCVGCGSIVGWKYEAAHDKNQKYKEGKFVLERFKVSGPDGTNYWLTHETQERLFQVDPANVASSSEPAPPRDLSNAELRRVISELGGVAGGDGQVRAAIERVRQTLVDLSRARETRRPDDSGPEVEANWDDEEEEDDE